MKKQLDEILKEEYKVYIKSAKKPMPFLEWASFRKETALKGAKKQLEMWESYQPSNKVVIKVKKDKEIKNDTNTRTER